MKKLFAAALSFLLISCSEELEESYASFAEAENDGAVKRGWVPAFVPKSARDIHDTHNLDTNAQTLEFRANPSDVHAMVAGLRPILPDDKSAAAELIKDFQLGEPSAAYIVCSGPLNGALIVNRKSGHAVYMTTINWADDDCS